MRRLAVAAVLLLLRAGAAYAQDEVGTNCDYQPIAGTVRYHAAMQAKQTAAAAFGAAAFVTERLMPFMSMPGGGQKAIGGFRFETLGPTVYVPSFAANPGCAGVIGRPNDFGIVSERGALGYMNQHMGATGFAGGWEFLQVFYAGSITQSKYVKGAWSDGFSAHLLGFGTPVALGAPAFREVFDESDSIDSTTYDYIVGLAAGYPGAISLRAGFVGSQGFYGGLNIPKASFDVGAAVTREFKDVAYLRGGFRDLMWPGGTSSLFTSASLLTGGIRVDPVTARPLDELPRSAQWVTQHFKHRIGGGTELDPFKNGVVIETEVAYQTHPASEFHLGRLDLGFGSGGIGGGGDYGYGGRATIGGGWIKLPEQRYMGAEGKGRPFFVAQATMTYKGKDVMPFGGRLAFNDPDALRLFPYTDANAFTLMVSLVFGNTKEDSERYEREQREKKGGRP